MSERTSERTSEWPSTRCVYSSIIRLTGRRLAGVLHLTRQRNVATHQALRLGGGDVAGGSAKDRNLQVVEIRGVGTKRGEGGGGGEE